MKVKKIKTIFLLVGLIYANVSFAQSGWYNTFVYNPNVITTLITADSNHYFSFSMNSMYYLRTTNGGENWTHHKLSDSTIDIRGGMFINSLTGWITGYNGIGGYYGIIYKTTDGGNNWMRQNCHPLQIICWSVYFINESTGWISGQTSNGGSVIKTTDGGNTWLIKTSLGTGIVRNLHFLNNSFGWMTGDNSYIGKTIDGGNNWINIANNTPMSNKLIQDFLYYDSVNYYVLARGIYPDPNGYIFKTTNSGLNWIQKYSYITGQDQYLYGIHFVSSMTGYAWGGTNSLVKTTNSGNNWFTLNQNYYSSNFSMYFKNENEFFIGGGNFGDPLVVRNSVLKTTNAGSNWFVNTRNLTVNFNKVLFTNDSVGFASIDSGKVYKTTNKGINWYQSLTSNSQINRMDFVNSMTGITVGSKVHRTTNGGATWQNIINPSSYHLITCNFLSPDTVLAADIGFCFKSTNCGINWINCSLPSSTYPREYTDFSFINSSTGYLLGHEYHPGLPNQNGRYYVVILKTINSGSNWSLLFSMDSENEVYFRFQMLDSLNGYLLKKNNGCYKTTNGGTSWQFLPISGLTNSGSIKMLNANTGWIGASTSLYKTINGGTNWVQQFYDYYTTPRSIYAFNENEAWFVGSRNSIYRTTNGGGIIGISTINSEITESFSLSQNYPNPFNPQTKIKFAVPSNVKGQTSNVKLIIYDLLGREVATIVNEELKSGTYEVDWDGSNYSSGVYFYKIISNDFVETKKMVLMK